MNSNRKFLCLLGISSALILLLARRIRARKARAKRSLWVNPYLQQRQRKGKFSTSVSK